jgi:phosphoinositide-3-kinase regulatory subunit 4
MPEHARGKSSASSASQGTAHERHDCHRDAIVALASVSASSGSMLISASRDMSVKVWK